ncbi:gamma carbonic anhydrase family protein [Labedella endophytica]|jgi:carbonic anhydrase/acetyltransferase-like protein (isoleucine patch superfamily)|uniref:Gamma carbonic anhydrase family protein n=1 Tax=Labedella endophytica TaxID=1523160 RepID=A0A3S0XX06_9MICO|nr:gamma carbonic anhydrase family protein [Labedella endophytica]RUQ97524.1 gamma carbonic anhydrase family protein [Labedella endophytica]
MSEETDAASPPLSLPGVPAPRVAEDAFLAPGARIVGNVTIGAGASVWYNAVLRAERAPIEIGERSNLQDGVAVHVDAGHGVSIGVGVSVGHNAVVHGCRIGDGSLIGMGAVVLSGAEIGEECLVAGGAVVLEGTVVPPRSLVAGVPARVRRSLTEEEVDGLRRNATTYVELSALHRAASAG